MGGHRRSRLRCQFLLRCAVASAACPGPGGDPCCAGRANPRGCAAVAPAAPADEAGAARRLTYQAAVEQAEQAERACVMATQVVYSPRTAPVGTLATRARARLPPGRTQRRWTG